MQKIRHCQLQTAASFVCVCVIQPEPETSNKLENIKQIYEVAIAPRSARSTPTPWTWLPQKVQTILFAVNLMQNPSNVCQMPSMDIFLSRVLGGQTTRTSKRTHVREAGTYKFLDPPNKHAAIFPWQTGTFKCQPSTARHQVNFFGKEALKRNPCHL